MDRNFSKNGSANWLALAAATVLTALLARYAGSVATGLVAALGGVGTLVALVAWFQMRLAVREEAERLELEALSRRRGDSSLFAESAAEAFPARRARESFERWVVPGFTVLLALAQGLAVWLFRRELLDDPKPLAAAAPFAAASLAGIGLVQLLLGLYSSKLARYAGVRLLRPGASGLVLGALLSLVAAGCQLAVWSGYPRWERLLAWAIWGIFCVITAETLLALVFEAYRPRVKGKEVRLIYESRLVGLLGQPTGLFTTAAQALDYQFGFQVSQTWFYKFLERAIAGLVLLQIAILWISTAVVVIEPGEQGLLERFGNPVASRPVLESGLHFKLPWPIDQVHRYNTTRLQSFNVGFVPKKEEERVLLWTQAHYAEEANLLVASREQTETSVLTNSNQTVPANLLTASVPVHFLVSDVRAWAYGHVQPAQLLERLATRELVRYLASVDLEKIMSIGRGEAADQLRQRIQAKANEAKLGVEVVFVGLQDIHPSRGSKEVPVAAAFEQVTGAEAEKEARILEAQAYRGATLPRAQAEATRIVAEARAQATQNTQNAIGQGGQFGHQLTAYQASPQVFVERNYLSALAQGVTPTFKLVLGADQTHDVVIVDLQHKIENIFKAAQGLDKK